MKSNPPLAAPASSRAAARRDARAPRDWAGPLVVGALTLLLALVNGLWLRANVVTYGWDRMDHLIASLGYNDVLRTVTPSSLVEALAWGDYYPPLVHLVVVLGYRLFGVSEDVAVMMNVLYLALLLGATWSIGRRLGGRGVATLATVVVATLPMIVTMSRYLYIDFALTALVAASVALLLASERFGRRGPSLGFGLALGATFLVKWTAAAFLAAPLLWVLWRSGVPATLLRQPRTLLPDARRLALSGALGGALAAAWLLPARAVVTQQPLGLWLLPLFGGLLAAVAYAGLSFWREAWATRDEARRRLAHALAAGAVAALLMALWYAVNVEFIQRFFYTAYGREEGRFWAYGKYLREVVAEQLGPLYAAVFVVAAILLLVGWLRRVRAGQSAGLDDTRVVLMLWAIVPYVIFSTRVSLAHSRFLMPFLPPLALAIALGLWRLRPPALRVGAVALVLTLAWAQVALLSFDTLAPWRDRLTVPLSSGPVNLMPHGFFIQYAAHGDTDPRYALAPDVLALVDEARAARGDETVALGLLVNSYQLHEKHFLYQIYTRFPQVRLRELARNWRDQPAYNQLFEMDYVLVSDTHTYRTDESSQAVAARLLSDPDDRFHRAFREVRRWVLPSGETIVLYGRRFAETQPGIAPDDYLALMETWGQEWGAGDALLLSAPDQIYVMGVSLPADSPVTLLPLPDGEHDPVANLEEAVQAHERLFLLQHNAAVADPDGTIEGWLRAHAIAGPEQWFGALRVVPVVPTTLPDTPTRALDGRFGDGPTLHGVALGAATLEPGGALPAALFWEAEATTGLKVSLQLLAPDGRLVAQQDAALVPGRQTFALLLPRALEPGPYRLVASVYDPNTLARLPLPDGTDSLTIDVLTMD